MLTVVREHAVADRLTSTRWSVAAVSHAALNHLSYGTYPVEDPPGGARSREGGSAGPAGRRGSGVVVLAASSTPPALGGERTHRDDLISADAERFAEVAGAWTPGQARDCPIHAGA